MLQNIWNVNILVINCSYLFTMFMCCEREHFNEARLYKFRTIMPTFSKMFILAACLMMQF